MLCSENKHLCLVSGLFGMSEVCKGMIIHNGLVSALYKWILASRTFDMFFWRMVQGEHNTHLRSKGLSQFTLELKWLKATGVPVLSESLRDQYSDRISSNKVGIQWYSETFWDSCWGIRIFEMNPWTLPYKSTSGQASLPVWSIQEMMILPSMTVEKELNSWTEVLI